MELNKSTCRQIHKLLLELTNNRTIKWKSDKTTTVQEGDNFFQDPVSFYADIESDSYYLVKMYRDKTKPVWIYDANGACIPTGTTEYSDQLWDILFRDRSKVDVDYIMGDLCQILEILSEAAQEDAARHQLTDCL